MHELNVGGLFTQLVFACPPADLNEVEIASIQLGPEISGKSAQKQGRNPSFREEGGRWPMQLDETAER